LKKYIAIEDMVNRNCANVLDIIQEKGTVSRKEITEQIGLSWGGMTKIVNKLLEKEYIKETKRENTTTTCGRLPSLLSINVEKNFIIGFDLNQTGLSAVVMNLAGEILKRFSAPADYKSADELRIKAINFLTEIFDNYEENSIIAIGIAAQGIVDESTGVCERIFLNGEYAIIPIKEIFEEHFNVKVFVEHDPDCMLFSHMGCGQSGNTILLRIDKGIGMAVSVNEKIIKGKGIFEIGHNCVVPNGLPCRCGKKGCFIAYTRNCFDEKSVVVPERTEELILPLSVTIQNLSNIFNADRIVLTGILMEHKELFEDKLMSQLKRLDCKSEIVFSPISDYAVEGAGLIAIKKSIASIEI